jgi:hypothetical protein
MRTCVHCDCEFDLNSPAKKRAGGKINECPDCSEESATRYLGLQAGDGKMSGVTILSFENASDRSQYLKYWRGNNGTNVGKSCQLSGSNPATVGVRFKTVTTPGAMNHKGRL